MCRFSRSTLVVGVIVTVTASLAQAQPGDPPAAPSPPAPGARSVEPAGPQPYAPPAPYPAYPAPNPAPYATQAPPPYPVPVPYGYSPWAFYEEMRKSAGLAFLFEFLLPGAGSIYADHTTGAIITWGLALGGMVVLLRSGRTTHDPYTGEDRTDFNDAQLAIGVLMLVGGRTYGLVDSIVSTRAYNERLRQRLGLRATLGLGAVPTAAGGQVFGPSFRLSF